MRVRTIIEVSRALISVPQFFYSLLISSSAHPPYRLASFVSNEKSQDAKDVSLSLSHHSPSPAFFLTRPLCTHLPRGVTWVNFCLHVSLAPQNPYPIIAHFVANCRPHLSHFWANDFLNLKVPKTCDPILVTLWKMPEKATPL